MIVRDEEHVVRETLDAVAPRIDYWVIVDTGSGDGTVEAIRSHMAALEIPGELHQRPWRDFGANRTEALELCRGKADYAWMIDADDLPVGDLDLTGLVADSYLLLYGPDFRYWRKQVFRDGLRWRYKGVVHEFVHCLDPASEARLEGDYHVESRRLGGRSHAADKYERDARLLSEALERDPDDERAAFYLAQSLFDAGDHAAALDWYTRRVAMGGWDEETFYSLLRRGACLEALGEPWERSLDAYLTAWQQRPTRVEPLHEIARHYRLAGEYRLGYLFAKRAVEIPFPEDDTLFVAADHYAWRVRDELAICAYWIGELAESFELCSALAEDEAVPEAERERVLGNRDLCVESLVEASAAYPAELVRRLAAREDDAAEPEVTLTITSCRRPALFERTVNSFLNCCEDVERIGRFVCVDNGSSEADRGRMAELYPFFEFIHTDPETERHAEGMNRILELLTGPYWLHLEDDWDFFAPQRYIERALAVLDDDPAIAQVAFNRNYGETLAQRAIAGGELRWTGRGRRRYRLHDHLSGEAWDAHLQGLEPGERTNAYWPHFTLRPSLIRADAVRRLGRFEPGPGHFEAEFAERFTAAGLRTAFFDEINCLHTGRLTSDAPGHGAPSAYELVGDGAHPAHPGGRGEAAGVEVRVINLDRREDRWRSFGERAEAAAGRAFAARCERFRAVDGSELELTPELRHRFRGNDFGFRRGMIGCALSHLAVWRELAESGASARLVLEDDARLCTGFDARLAELGRDLEREHPDFDAVLLGLYRHGEIAPSTPADDRRPLELRPLRADGFLGGSFAYLLSAKGARRLLELADRDGIRNGIDVFVVRHHEELALFECDPQFAGAPLAGPAGAADSDIQYDVDPVADAASEPVALTVLARGALVGELRLDLEPHPSVVSATIAHRESEGGLRVAVRTEQGDGDYLVVLDEELTVTGVEPAAYPDDAATAVAIGAGRLSIESNGDGASSAHRFVIRDGASRVTAASPGFTFLGGRAETFGGLTLADGELAIAFASDGKAGIAVLEQDELEELLEPC
ncbi:MAG: hypothetical protein QOI10_210 [Solirubrobacterales bacterium]|jgi:GR25 family glycosyltransferase involved in LPS biosynthesis/glycosyltransferase involved in cell wall biosynthesis/GT2 family glycosyltransferase|nr:hypothetical protein [Solirubrobacterales bacterium]